MEGKAEKDTHCYERLVFFIVSELKNPVKNAQSFGESDLKKQAVDERIAFKIFMCTLLLFTLQ